MSLHRHAQSGQQPLGGEVVEDDAFGDSNRFLRHTHGLRVETEIDDQFFWRTRDPAKVRVTAGHVAVIQLNLLSRLARLCLSAGFLDLFCGILKFFFLVCHLPLLPSNSIKDSSSHAGYPAAFHEQHAVGVAEHVLDVMGDVSLPLSFHHILADQLIKGN